MIVVKHGHAEFLSLAIRPHIPFIIDAADDEQVFTFLDKRPESVRRLSRFADDSKKCRSEKMLEFVPVARCVVRRVLVQTGGKAVHSSRKILLRFIRKRQL